MDTIDQQPSQNRHIIPFHLFEELFGPFIFQSRNIEITYAYQVREPSAELFGEIAISSVNGSSTPDEFRGKLSTLLNDSLQLFHDSLKQKNGTIWAPFIEHVRSKLGSLTSIVTDEKVILPDESGKCTLHHHFKSFTDCKMIGPGLGYYNIFNQGIRYKAEKFALAWLQVIDDAIKQLDLIQDLLHESLKQSSNQSPQTTPEVNDFHPKFNLSVSQLGYFLNLLVRTGMIDLPPRQVTALINFFSENFQSKNQVSIQSASLRNKYSVHDFAAQDYMEKMLEEMFAMILEDREKLSR